MNEVVESAGEELGVTEKDLSSMRKLRIREVVFRLGRGVLCSTVGFLAGFIPAAALVLHYSGTSSSYPYASALAVGAVAPRNGAKKGRPKALYVISFPLLLLFFFIGIGLNLSMMNTVTYYGVCDGR
jgi:hypothetical protein